MAAITRTGAANSQTLEVRATRDRESLRGFLEQDRLFAAYAICDLEEREFPRTRWGIAMDRGQVVAVVLEYSGLSPQPLFVMGDDEGVAAILEDVIHPRTAYLAALTHSLPAVERVYRMEAGPPMVRMWVDRAKFLPVPQIATRLMPAEIGDLNRLYDLGFSAWLPADAIRHGVYYGVRVEGRLVAAAGTHVIGRDARLGVVGNVMTHREHRSQGFAKLTTGAVTAELLRTCDQVVLNVRSDNPPALAAYRALGYQEHVRFEERIVHRRGALWDSITLPFRRWFPHSKES
ncbi:MAG: GNAT family N-acetyltransferase [Chloroflexi bacterium]|nr:GNAT family N-acetyltransferase [Chloroflexota bacterium]MBA3626979.1 GNAT family N-acetyltransferase [Chloroflexota bacterium]MDQ3407302.1 GNAT family N-acetyltransferase [Chloroflexota bacterium]